MVKYGTWSIRCAVAQHLKLAWGCLAIARPHQPRVVTAFIAVAARRRTGLQLLLGAEAVALGGADGGCVGVRVPSGCWV